MTTYADDGGGGSGFPPPTQSTTLGAPAQSVDFTLIDTTKNYYRMKIQTLNAVGGGALSFRVNGATTGMTAQDSFVSGGAPFGAAGFAIGPAVGKQVWGEMEIWRPVTVSGGTGQAWYFTIRYMQDNVADAAQRQDVITGLWDSAGAALTSIGFQSTVALDLAAGTYAALWEADA